MALFLRENFYWGGEGIKINGYHPGGWTDREYKNVLILFSRYWHPTSICGSSRHDIHRCHLRYRLQQCSHRLRGHLRNRYTSNDRVLTRYIVKCPNDCSYNGYCKPDETCDCIAGFTGSDCAQSTKS